MDECKPLIMGNGTKRKAEEALRAWSEEAAVAKVMRSAGGFLAVRPARCCPPRHPTHFEPTRRAKWHPMT